MGTAYLSAGRGPVLALRAGAQASWGRFPLQYATFLGGSPSLRGYSLQRFAGDRAAFGGAEVRTVLTRANLLVRGDLGVIALADAGRVWYGGDSDGSWHTAVGGGAFFRFRQQAVSVVYARGEGDVIYLRMGLPF
jgi:hemolysin activation/secretion protein